MSLSKRVSVKITNIKVNYILQLRFQEACNIFLVIIFYSIIDKNSLKGLF